MQRKNAKASLTLDKTYLDLKEKMIASLTSLEGITLTDLRKQMKADIVGEKIPSKYFSKWTQDVFYQYERHSKNKIRKRLGLRFGIYQGGVIDTTRPFCNARNGKVFSDEEIESWQKLEFAGKNDNYDPIVDLGGHRCRHRIDWISDELAYRKRPDLEKKIWTFKIDNMLLVVKNDTGRSISFNSDDILFIGETKCRTSYGVVVEGGFSHFVEKDITNFFEDLCKIGFFVAIGVSGSPCCINSFKVSIVEQINVGCKLFIKDRTLEILDDFNSIVDVRTEKQKEVDNKFSLSYINLN